MSRFSRRDPVKEPAVVIIIFTEGEKTEPQYLEMFKEIHVEPFVKRSVFDLKIISGVGIPITVVDRATQELENLQGPLSKKDSVWVMFDRDEHPKFEEAKNKARSKGIHLAVSNPCFEVWGIYHYRDWQSFIERDQCQKELGKLCPNYNQGSGKTFADQDVIEDKCYDAIKRAEKSLDSRKREGNPEGNPSTSIHCLIKKILSKVKELKNTMKNRNPKNRLKEPLCPQP